MENQVSSLFDSQKGILNTPIKSARIDRFLPFIWKNGEVSLKVFNGSGDITALIGTSGMIHIPKNTTCDGDPTFSY